MSGDLVHVPEAARDPALTPTQRFEMIARTARGMEQYRVQGETGESQRTPQQRNALAIRESAEYVERMTDQDGMVSYHKFPANLASGYSLPAMPAGTRVLAGEMYKNLSVFRGVGLSQDIVNRLVLEYARQWK
jgi:hypothetical protein